MRRIRRMVRRIRRTCNSYDPRHMPRRLTAKTAIFAELLTATDLSVAVGVEALGAHGVDARGFMILVFVAEAQPVSPTALARQRMLTRTTLRDGIQRLVDEGDLERVPSAVDRRSQVLRLTEQGEDRVARGLRALEDAAERVQAFLERPLEHYVEAVAELQEGFRALAPPPARA